MIFELWLEPIWQRLLQQVLRQKIPHAFLFCGPKGIGKTQLVQTFEQLLLCQSPTKDGACGQCRSCYLYLQQHHPDFKCLSFDDEGIGIDDIRNMSHYIEQTSHQQGRKVVSLLGADKLLPASANALLKTLEEPLGDAVLLLVAENLKLLLPTIKSRCFIINIPQPALEIVNENHQQRIALMQAFSEGNVKAFEREDIQQFIVADPFAALYLIYYWLIEIIRYALQSKTDFLFNDVNENQLKSLLQTITTTQVFTFLDNVQEAIKHLSLPGVNKSLVFESLFCQWQDICQGEKKYGRA
ncbi:MAG: DNA polymerase III subunit [Gammaproteobacteria bacterium]|jgi:DNA polymerase-3 subunit delta'|nr:DNA polymerase III subunit [Gammaproteobacteria bacterium]